MPLTKVTIRETHGLHENTSTVHLVEPPPIAETAGDCGPRSAASDHLNEAKLNELISELATFVARERSAVQTITLQFHVEAKEKGK